MKRIRMGQGKQCAGLMENTYSHTYIHLKAWAQDARHYYIVVDTKRVAGVENRRGK